MPTPTFTQVTPHIFRLPVSLLKGRLGTVSVWLVQGERGWILVDAGLPGAEQLVMDQVQAHTGGSLPQWLVLTHGHMDHVAAAQRIRQEWRVPIAAGRDEVPYLLGPWRYSHIPTSNLAHRLLQISPPGLLGLNVHLPLDDGARLDGLEVFAAPGHAPGMIALLHRADRALLCADAFFHNKAGKLVDPWRPFTYDPLLNHQSQARLASLDFDHLLVSHGEPILGQGRAQAQALVAGRQKPDKKR